MVFDTLLYLDGNGLRAFIPRNSTSFNLDSFDVVFSHTNTSTHNDTLHITLFNRASLVVSGVGSAAGNLTQTTLWDTLIITNQSLSTGSATNS